MDTATKNYIDSLNRRSIPWNRMFTAYGTAEHYNELLSVLEETTDEEQWKKTFNRLSDFEHQSTMFPPAPFALVFLVRILQKLLQDASAGGIAKKLTDQFIYYAEVCCEAEKLDHAPPLSHFEDLFDDGIFCPKTVRKRTSMKYLRIRMRFPMNCSSVSTIMQRLFCPRCRTFLINVECFRRRAKNYGTR